MNETSTFSSFEINGIGLQAEALIGQSLRPKDLSTLDASFAFTVKANQELKSWMQSMPIDFH